MTRGWVGASPVAVSTLYDGVVVVVRERAEWTHNEAVTRAALRVVLRPLTEGASGRRTARHARHAPGGRQRN